MFDLFHLFGLDVSPLKCGLSDWWNKFLDIWLRQIANAKEKNNNEKQKYVDTFHNIMFERWIRKDLAWYSRVAVAGAM